jgi:hypothetical protein
VSFEEKAMNADEFDHAIEIAVGERLDVIRGTPVEERRRTIESRLGRAIRFVSHFPFIGRGNVLRDRFVSHEQAEGMLEEALRDGDQ